MRRRQVGLGMRLTAVVAAGATTGLWLLTPPAQAQAIQERVQRSQPRQVSELKPGLTQCLTKAQWAAYDAKRAKEAAEKDAHRPAVRLLSHKEMTAIHGRGLYRNKYLSGTLPWHRALRDANLCTGNLFKSFTDIQVQPAKGAGLALQRTYNSNDSHLGPFGIGWTHAYDIRMEEAQGADQTDYDPTAPNPNGDTNYSTRQDFFGHKHKYHRDADGLYSPPPSLYDENSSDYAKSLVSGPIVPTDDTDIGMDGTIKHFIANGTNGVRSCDYIKDRYGNTTVLAYDPAITLPDGSNPLKTVTDPSGRQLVFYTQNLGTISAPQWRVVQVDGPLYSVVYRYTADAYGNFNLTGVTLDAAAPATGVSSVVAGNGTHQDRTTTFGYTSYSDGNGNTETGLLNSITDPLGPVEGGHSVSYTYAAPSTTVTNTLWVNTITEPAGVDTGGHQRNLTWTISPPGPGSLTSSFTATDGVSTLLMHVLFDTNLRLVTYFTENIGAVSDYSTTYDSANNVRSQTTDVFFGASSEQQRVDNYTYGPHGNVLTHTITGFSGTETTVWYNASQYFQKQSVTDFNGHTTTFGVGTRTAGTTGDPDPNPGDRGSVLWVKDALYGDGTLNPTGTRFQYSYDSYGRKLSETNQNSVVTNYTYGGTGDATVNGVAVGNLTQVVQDPGSGHLNRTTNMQYDIAGHVLQSVDPLSLTSSFSYNNLGQPVSASFPAKASTPAETVSYLYDGNGRTHSVQDNRGTTVFSYEPGSDRVSSATDPITGSVGYTYGLFGQRLTMTLPGGGSWSYAYAVDAAGQGPPEFLPKDDPNSLALRLLNFTDDQGRRVDLLYPTNQYTSNVFISGRYQSIRSNQTFSGGTNLVSYLQTDYTYNGTAGPAFGATGTQASNYWWKDANNQWHSNLVAQNVYCYDNLGQRLSNQVTDNLGNSRTESYAYDALNRLTAVNYGDGQTQGDPTHWQQNPGYTFDAMGNRLTKQDSVTGAENYGYNAANMLTGRNGTNNYTNDLDGNTLTGGGRTNTWDSENRLAQCVYTSNGSTTTSQYTYGADGLRRRSAITTNGVTTTTDSVLDAGMFVRELRTNPQTQTVYNYATYLTGPRGPEYRRDDVSTGTPVRWYVYDGLGSVLAEVDPSGNVTASRKYDVYGGVRTSTGTSTSKHKFVGSLGHPSDDESGLIYMQARYVDVQTGRFINEDSAKRGINWFRYCHNSPINRTDANGKDDTLAGTMEAVADCTSIDEAIDAIAEEIWTAVDREGEEYLVGGGNLEGSAGTMPGQSPMGFFKQWLIERGQGDFLNQWEYAYKEVSGAGGQFLKAWIRINMEEGQALWASGNGLFEHVTPYVGDI